MPLLSKHFDRIKHVHFKDVRNEKLKACHREEIILNFS